MRTRFGRLLVLVVGVLALAASASAARLPVCPDAAYVLHRSVLGGPRTRGDVLAVDAGEIAIQGLCPAAPVRLRGSRRGTKVTARWSDCPGLGRVTVRGAIDPSCSTWTGILRAPGLKVPFVATKTTGDSLRMLTYNVQQLPSFFNARTSDTGSKHIVERILAAGYDVVVLNEVFDEDSRDVFEKGLKGAFPYYVADLDGDTVGAEDSGLMLFSRFPFQDPIMGFHTPDPGDDCFGSDCADVRFLIYGPCDGDDCMAEKGVGYVRLRNPDTDTIYNVLFTHTQASYLDDDHDEAGEHVVTRGVQFLDMELSMLGNLAQVIPQLYQEPIFVLGDLNVDGDLASPFLSANGEPTWEKKNIAEWQQVFGDPGSLWHDTLIDGWAFDNAPKHPSGVYDRGISNRMAWGPGEDGARLDYVAHNDTRLCVQHMTLAHNLRWSPPNGTFTESGMGPAGIGLAGTAQLSDHIGLNADVNLEAPYCRPVDALALDPTPGTPTVVPSTLKYPGSMQWFRFDEPGTYSFAVMSQNGTDFRVYEADDLSTPIAQYKNLTTTVPIPSSTNVEIEAKVFHAAKAPFYVRVFDPERTASGPYKLVALEHDCATKEFACALGPGEERSHELLPTPPVNNPDEAWFIATPEALPGGLQQHVVLVARDMGIPAVFHLDVEDANGTLLGQALVSEADPQSPGAFRYRLELDDSAGTMFYLVVRRQPAGNIQPPYPDGARMFRVWWRTNLTILYGSAQGGQTINLGCHEENDPSPDDGDDEYSLDYIKADGTAVASSVDLGNFDATNVASLEPFFGTPLYFFSSVEFKFIEDDDTFTGDDDVMYGVVAPLAPEQATAVGAELVLHDQDGAGTYVVYYNLTHGFDR